MPRYITPTLCFSRCFTVGQTYTANERENSPLLSVIDNLGHERFILPDTLDNPQNTCPHLGNTSAYGSGYVAGYWKTVERTTKQ